MTSHVHRAAHSLVVLVVYCPRLRRGTGGGGCGGVDVGRGGGGTGLI